MGKKTREWIGSGKMVTDTCIREEKEGDMSTLISS